MAIKDVDGNKLSKTIHLNRMTVSNWKAVEVPFYEHYGYDTMVRKI